MDGRWDDGSGPERSTSLADENGRLKVLAVEALLDNRALKELLARNW